MLVALAVTALSFSPLHAQETAVPGGARAIPAPADTAYPGGTIALDIDATDTARNVYRVEQTFPVARNTRSLTLLFPEWLPGNHAPRGPIAELVDLRLEADGKPVEWRRDPIDVYAFHVDLPAGTRTLVARFLHTSPIKSSQGRVTMTREMLNLQWEKMSLYPAGHAISKIRVKPTVTFPAGWKQASGMQGSTRRGDTVTWPETDYETLVDSPIFAGAYFREFAASPTEDVNIVADAPQYLAMDDSHKAAFSSLFEEARALFGTPAYDRYEFLIALTDRMGGIGLEHLTSSENQLEPKALTEWDKMDWDRNVLPHELVHSWNGKFRRPARLWTPDYSTPMQDDLLWVYEGQTQFWGLVLAVRSGMQTKATVLGKIADVAGTYAELPGRAWRSVGDTTLDPVIAARKPKPFSSLARGEDYYNEGALIWLEADQIIRKGTGGAKGLDDFARAFFSHPEGAGRISRYERSDVVAALNGVYAHDWEGFFRERIDGTGRPAPLAGIRAAGYDLVWKDTPNPNAAALMDERKYLDLVHSLGVSVDADGTVTGTQWGSPAFDKGIVADSVIVAVDGRAYSHDTIKGAITRAASDNKPIELIVRRGDAYSVLSVPYTGGLRYPWLEKTAKGEAGLDRLLAARR